MNTGITRRSLGLAAAGWGSIWGQSAKPVESGGPNTIHFEVDYKTAPKRIYEALLDAKQFAAMTKAAAEIDARAGGAFKLFGGLIEGRTVELVPNQRIVQAWRPASWPAGVYSVVRFELSARPGGGARIVFDHTGFPDGKKESLSDGWQDHYWGPLHSYLNA